jgi:hypothetical protein
MTATSPATSSASPIADQQNAPIDITNTANNQQQPSGSRPLIKSLTMRPSSGGNQAAATNTNTTTNSKPPINPALRKRLPNKGSTQFATLPKTFDLAALQQQQQRSLSGTRTNTSSTTTSPSPEPASPHFPAVATTGRTYPAGGSMTLTADMLSSLHGRRISTGTFDRLPSYSQHAVEQRASQLKQLVGVAVQSAESTRRSSFALLQRLQGHTTSSDAEHHNRKASVGMINSVSHPSVDTILEENSALDTSVANTSSAPASSTTAGVQVQIKGLSIRSPSAAAAVSSDVVEPQSPTGRYQLDLEDELEVSKHRQPHTTNCYCST